MNYFRFVFISLYQRMQDDATPLGPYLVLPGGQRRPMGPGGEAGSLESLLRSDQGNCRPFPGRVLAAA